MSLIRLIREPANRYAVHAEHPLVKQPNTPIEKFLQLAIRVFTNRMKIAFRDLVMLLLVIPGLTQVTFAPKIR